MFTCNDDDEIAMTALTSVARVWRYRNLIITIIITIITCDDDDDVIAMTVQCVYL